MVSSILYFGFNFAGNLFGENNGGTNILQFLLFASVESNNLVIFSKSSAMDIAAKVWHGGGGSATDS